MNKQKILTGLTTAAILALPLIAGAQPSNQGLTLCSLVQKIQSAVWIIFGVIAVIMFVVAGILFLTAQGSPDKIAQARTAVLWGVAGVVVGIIAFSIISIVSSAMGLNAGSAC